MNKLVCLATIFAAGCGYHVTGNTLPQTITNPKGSTAAIRIHTIAVPAFTTGTVRYKLTRLLPTDITQELISRTKYNIVADPGQADAVLKGSLLNFVVYQVISDPATGRATGAEIVVTVQITLTDRATGKVLFTRPSLEFRERYEISTDPQTYFDESGTAIERVARDVARSVVSAMLNDF